MWPGCKPATGPSPRTGSRPIALLWAATTRAAFVVLGNSSRETPQTRKQVSAQVGERVWAEKLERDDSHVVLTEAGAMKVRSVRRLPQEPTPDRRCAQGVRSTAEPKVRPSSASRAQPAGHGPGSCGHTGRGGGAARTARGTLPGYLFKDGPRPIGMVDLDSVEGAAVALSRKATRQTPAR